MGPPWRKLREVSVRGRRFCRHDHVADESSRQAEAKTGSENDIGNPGQRQPNCSVEHQPPAPERSRDSDEKHRGGDNPAQQLEQQHLRDEPAGDERHCKPIELEPALVRNMAEEALPQNGEPDDDEPSRNEEWKQARANCSVSGSDFEPRSLDGNEYPERENAAAKQSFANPETAFCGHAYGLRARGNPAAASG